MRNLQAASFATLILLTASGVGTVQGQSAVNHASLIVLVAQQQASAAHNDSDEQRKKMASDTAKLLQLATELKAAVDKSSKNELSLDVVRKADEIEHLAHEMKQHKN